MKLYLWWVILGTACWVLIIIILLQIFKFYNI